MPIFKRLISAITSAVIMITAIPIIGNSAAYAAESYPVQEFRLGMSDTNNNVCANGSSLMPSVMTGEDDEKWSLNFVSDGVYEIVNSDSGKILTAFGSGVSLAADTDGANQRWKIEGVEKDFDGYYLYYKITSNVDSSKSLTFSETSGFGLSSYSGEGYQKYKLNLDGVEGFAANCKVTEGEKACTIGGLLGETVTVTDKDTFITELNSTEPKTIVVNGNFDMQEDWHTRIRDNKTIVGSYGANTLQDCYLRTNNEYGTEGDEPSDNIIIRNINFKAVNAPNRILVNIWSSRQIWIDHCSFTSELTYDRTGNGQDEVGKFIWINTPYDSYMDAKDRLRSPDYISISYCTFKNRYWTVAYGTQNDETTRCRTTLCYNKWDKNVRRCPQIGNGIGHVYNNYFEGYDSGNGGGTSQIIAGDGSNMVSENCRFQSYSNVYQQCISAGGGDEPYRDSGSYWSTSSSATPQKVSFTIKTPGTWYPNKSNYGYSLVSAYNTNNTDTKYFCNTYAGCFNSADKLKYITDSDMSKYIETKYESPFLKAVDLSVPAVNPATLTEGGVYKIKNVNSGMYLAVDGNAKDSANVIQSSEDVANMWRVFAAPKEGYYYMYSLIGDGATYCLNLKDGSTANGANIEILKQNYKDAQQVMFVANDAGTAYTIRPRSADGATGIGVSGASKESGANVVSWEINGSADQEWTLESVAHPGVAMDTSVNYEFENVNSKMVMDIESGTMADNINVQQWATGNFKSQQWTLKPFSGGGSYYYIHSVSNPDYVLKAESSTNGGNIFITTYSTKDSAMLFKFAKNPDGTYHIMTRASKDTCLVEIADASTSSGANVQQWEPTYNDCQKWNAVTFTTTTVTTTATTTTTTTTTTTETQPIEVAGDINADGKCEVADVVLLQKWLVNKGTLTENQLKIADVNKDGKINVFDLIIIKRIIFNVK